MLEHGIDAPDAGEDPAASVLKPADADHYVPKHTAEVLTGSARPPSVKRFNRKAVAAIAVIAGAVITLAFWMGLQQAKPKPPEPVATTANPPEVAQASHAVEISRIQRISGISEASRSSEIRGPEIRRRSQIRSGSRVRRSLKIRGVRRATFAGGCNILCAARLQQVLGSLDLVRSIAMY